MPWVKYYDAKGELLKTAFEPMNDVNLEQFKKDNGEEQTIGYLKAMKDFQQHMFQILRTPDDRYPQSDWHVHKNLKRFYEAQESFLDRAEIKNIFGQSSEASSKPDL